MLMKVSDPNFDANIDDQFNSEQLVRVANELLSATQLFDDFSEVQILRQLLRQAYETVPAPRD
jgi:hypothetical protein